MDAKDWIEVIDNIFWWIVSIGVVLLLLGVFDKD